MISCNPKKYCKIRHLQPDIIRSKVLIFSFEENAVNISVRKMKRHYDVRRGKYFLNERPQFMLAIHSFLIILRCICLYISKYQENMNADV